MPNRINVGIILGGRSAEHEVSLQSAKNVIDSLDPEKYKIIILAISKDGLWYLKKKVYYLRNMGDPQNIELTNDSPEVALAPAYDSNQIIYLKSGAKFSHIDVAFPVLHGTYGEDGSIQGYLNMLDIPFVGPDILGSSVGMDKDIMKRILRDSGFNIAEFVTLKHYEKDDVDLYNIIDKLGLPLFVKPANLGSSVGISKALNIDELKKAIDFAFQFDTKLIIEQNIEGREIEVAVLGNDHPKASLPGEIIPQHDFYSYDAKYIDNNGAKLAIPADLDKHQSDIIRQYAVDVFKALCCEGMARVDLFYTKEQQIIVNEINTIPGFTKISMYPKLWEVTGLQYSQLLDTLIDLAIERHQRKKKLLTTIK